MVLQRWRRQVDGEVLAEKEGCVGSVHRSEEVENVEHWLLRYTGMAEEREKLIMTVREKVEWQSMEDDERVAAASSPRSMANHTAPLSAGSDGLDLAQLDRLSCRLP